MKRQLTKLLTVMLCVLSLAALCFGMAACGAKSYEVTLDYNGEQGSVTLSPTAEGNKYEEGSKVTVTVTAKDGYEIDTFTVSTDANAKLADGKYELTVSADTTVKATFKTAAIAVTGITLTPDTLALEVGGTTESATATLVAEVAPADATDKTVTWTSSDPTVATVEGGNVTALAAGETTITATAGGKSATCTVTVTQHVHTAKDATYLQDTENNKHYQLCECGARVNEAEHAAAEDAEWKQDAENNQHYKECVCGEHVEVAAHTAKDATYQQDTENNKHYQLCECGARVNEAEHAAAEDAEWKQDAENNQHYKECVCGEHVEVAAHTAKNATYQQDTENNKHYQLCECGARVNEAEHAAADEEEWEHDEGDKTSGKHWQVCVCGEKVNEGAHDMDPEAFSDGAAGHHYECEECGFKTATQQHVNASGKWTQHTDFNKGHYYNCSVCEAEVTQSHEIERYSNASGLSRRCKYCDFDEFISAHEITKLVSDGAESGTHHFECDSVQHKALGCTYKTESVSCANAQYMTWTQDAEDPASGHVGTCQCGNQVSVQSHDALGEDGKCSKCGYRTDEHVCVDNAVNGYYDGVCDICTKNFNNTWNFDATTGTILKYGGAYEKICVPVEIDNKEVKIIKAATSGSDTGFTKNTTIKAIMIPENSAVEALPINMFMQCTQLMSISIRSSKITSIPNGFATMCSNLEWIVLPATITTVNANSFLRCTALTAVYFLGNSSQWSNVTVSDTTLSSKTPLYYNADSGTETEWHWDTDMVTPKPWKEE